MSWLRLDDRFWRHPKINGLSDRAFRLHILGLCYCAEFSTDGFVDNSSLGLLHAALGRRYTAGSEPLRHLVESGLWETWDGGFMIHDFLDYNPSAAQVKAKRLRDAERQRIKREA